MKVLIAEKISEKGLKVFMESEVQVDVTIKPSREKLLEIIPEYDAIVVRSYTKVDEELFSHASKLKVVGRAGNGVDNIDMQAATRHGVIVVNTPDANSISAAEHTIGLMLAASRKTAQANEAMHKRIWDTHAYIGVELYRKTLGIIGLGRIGGLVAERLQSFGMNIMAYDPYIADSRFEKYSVEKKESLEEMMPEIDFLTIHTPKTKETLGMVGRKELSMAKKGLRIVNCARGGLIDEEALDWAVTEGIVAAGGVDVLKDEPETTSPLFDLEHIVLTPHLGAGTVEAQDNVGVSIAHEVLGALRGEMVPNAVNMPALNHHELDQVRHSLQLGEILGKFYHQLNREAVDRLEVIYSGDTAGMETNVITLAVLKGLLEPVIQEKVNYVNAGLLAKNRGIEVVESRVDEHEHYHNYIQLKVHAKDRLFTIGGTVFGKREVRISEINGYAFDAIPSDHMLVAEYIDQPGMIGIIGTQLGKNQINIANMQVNRNIQREKAMMIMSVDSEPDAGALNEITQVEGIMKIQSVQL